MTTTCNHCRKPLAPHDSHDLRVMRPVHKHCHAIRIQQRPKLERGHDKVSDLPMDVKNTLRGGR